MRCGVATSACALQSKIRAGVGVATDRIVAIVTVLGDSEGPKAISYAR
jgi:hypothetical protein